jgi:hypothetical protein
MKELANQTAVALEKVKEQLQEKVVSLVAEEKS